MLASARDAKGSIPRGWHALLSPPHPPLSSTSSYTHICTHTDTRTCTHIHIHIHTHTHIYTDIHTIQLRTLACQQENGGQAGCWQLERASSLKGIAAFTLHSKDITPSSTPAKRLKCAKRRSNSRNLCLYFSAQAELKREGEAVFSVYCDTLLSMSLDYI